MSPAPVRWSSRLSFLLAAVGAAVGLGNIWKFPYITGMHGGGAFVLVYLGAVAFVALPILIAELMIGRRGRGSPPQAMAAAAVSMGRSRRWGLAGWTAMLAAYLILSYYSVIAGWTLYYAALAAQGDLTGLTADAAAEVLATLMASPGRMAMLHGLFMLATVVIVMRGLKEGIEKAVKVLMPLLFVALAVMTAYALVVGDAVSAVDFLFAADFSRIDGNTVLVAVGQAFFSIGVAMGLMMAYGSYLPDKISIPRVGLVIVVADTAVALVAGLAIFPLVFAHGIDPAEGPGLIFVAMPLAVGHMPGGALFGIIFFGLLVCAALTSTIAVLEPMVEWGSQRFGAPRRWVAMVAGALAWLIGLLSIFSFNVLADWHPFAMLGVAKHPFDLLDYLTANIMMPVGALLLAVFGGYLVPASTSRAEFGSGTGWHRLWLWSIRVIAPLALLALFVENLV